MVWPVAVEFGSQNHPYQIAALGIVVVVGGAVGHRYLEAPQGHHGKELWGQWNAIMPHWFVVVAVVVVVDRDDHEPWTGLVVVTEVVGAAVGVAEVAVVVAAVGVVAVVVVAAVVALTPVLEDAVGTDCVVVVVAVEAIEAGLIVVGVVLTLTDVPVDWS